MKMREQHIVPLSTQAIAIRRERHALTGSGRYVFPGARTDGRPMSENAVLAALRRMGYSKDHKDHSDRAQLPQNHLHAPQRARLAPRDSIERQLAHVERNNVRAAYNFAEHLPERRKMMQAWADYLDDRAA
jgi:integrase